MTHEDQIQFYSCPLCGAGDGNDLEETREDEKHDCPVEKEMRAEATLSSLDKPLTDKEKITEENCEHPIENQYCSHPESCKDVMFPQVERGCNLCGAKGDFTR